MKLSALFESDVTRDIPPVVYFHEQSPEKLAAEVREYIITGGFPDGHPHKSRVPSGIHEQYVKLLTAIAGELKRKGGPDLPAAWISGFYGSGKSSFAKLLGLALDGVALPDGRSLAQALLARDSSPRSQELAQAYAALRADIDPISVVFDVGGVARDEEHIHSAVVRQVQRRLGYCTDAFVAEMEVRLEMDKRWADFEAAAQRTLGRPWAEAKRAAMADDAFSQVMHALMPERFIDPMAWIAARAGAPQHASSAEEAVELIGHMLDTRAKGKTLFVVVDEVSQYVHQDHGRMLMLQSFVSSLGQRLKGRAWLLVTGQEKLEEGGDQNLLGKMKDRFPDKLRVHLAATNIRDVVHKRLLAKRKDCVEPLKALYNQHKSDLRLFAYGCEDITSDDFVEVYPLLPQHIDLVLKITSALRNRSRRSQGDDQAIRGLLQLLGELFRSHGLADAQLGTLVTLDQVFDVQASALDNDTQATLTRILRYCAAHSLPLAERAAKAVALLELIQDTLPTDAKLVASCLHGRLDLGSQEEAVRAALETLRAQNLLGYSEKTGYKIQSSAGEEWERELRDQHPSDEKQSEEVRRVLTLAAKNLERFTYKEQPFALHVLFSDGRSADDVSLVGTRDANVVELDLRYLREDEAEPATWVNRSAESTLQNRVIWLAGALEEVRDRARAYGASDMMVRRYKPIRETLSPEKQRLVFEEETRLADLDRALGRAAEAAFVSGALYFRGKRMSARELGQTFSGVARSVGERVLPELYPHFVNVHVSDADVLRLIEPVLNAPSERFIHDLGILALDAGRYVPKCDGQVPTAVAEYVGRHHGISGGQLLRHFGGPPYGYAPSGVRAAVAGLLRAHRLRIQTENGTMLSAVRDAGVREVFEKDRGFRGSTFLPADGQVDHKALVRLCKMFKERFGVDPDRESDAIADAVESCFRAQGERLRGVFERWRKLPGGRAEPAELVALDAALTACVRHTRATEPTVRACLSHFDALNEGLKLLAVIDSELTAEAVSAVQKAHEVGVFQGSQLEALGDVGARERDALAQLRAQLEAERPWLGIHQLAEAQKVLREAYQERRTQLLGRQEEAAEAARRRVKQRAGFATLNNDQSHSVLRPIQEALPHADAAALMPTLVTLRDGYQHALDRAVEDANDKLDQILSEGRKPQIRKLQINLQNREVTTPEELERLLDELRTRALEQLRTGARVRFI